MATIDPLTAAAVPVVTPPRAASPGKTLEPWEHRTVLTNVSWDTYERLVGEVENPGKRFTFDNGVLEIMSPISHRHEMYKSLLASQIEALTEELRIPRRSLGGATWLRKDLDKGLEADECYYLTSAPKVRGKLQIDLTVDPPPDLAVEVENTSSAIDKLGIYALLGIPEVWRFDGETLTILRFGDDRQYSQQPSSVFFPAQAIPAIVRFLTEEDLGDETQWCIRFRQWVRDNLVKPA
jgi:Uma2 family endonuclease